MPVVSDENELRAGGVRVGGQHSHQFGVNHRGLVDHDDRSAGPCLPSAVQREQLAVDCRCLLEAFSLHFLNNDIGRSQSYDICADCFVNLPDRRHRVALPGSGLAVDQRQATCPRRVSNSPNLIVQNRRKGFAAKHRCAGLLSRVVALVFYEDFRRAQDVPLRFENGAGRVAGRGAGGMIFELNDIRIGKHPLAKLNAFEYAFDLLRQCAVKVGQGESGPLFGHCFDNSLRVAGGNRIP